MSEELNKTAAEPIDLKPETVLVLRTCNANMTSPHDHKFLWPTSGPVACPDWNPTQECGNGLHGALWGEGHGDLFNWAVDAKWLVVEVIASEIVNLDGKVKFPRGNVVYCGNRLGATEYMVSRAPGRAVIGAAIISGYRGTATAGYRGTATAGYGGTATAGYRGTATAGYRGTATAGYRGTATAGYRGTATAGYGGTATAGDGGTATAGDGGTATAGDGGTATAGDGGTATAGDGGTATAGDGGTATAGDGGTATAGELGTLQIRWWDGRRYRTWTGYVGEDGIQVNAKYRLDEYGKPHVIVETK